MAAPDWLPLWTDASAYPSPDSLQPWQWAWEFLRRNRVYQDKWDEIIGPLKTGDLNNWTVIAPFISEFGITFAPPPWDDTPFLVLLKQYTVGGAVSDDVEAKTGSVPIGGLEHAVVFDLSLDVDTQIETTRRILLHRIDRLVREGKLSVVPSTRAKPHLWLEYLRLLDAEACGASVNEMAKKLYPTEPNAHPDFKAKKTVQNRLRAAHKMRDEGYRFIRGYHGIKMDVPVLRRTGRAKASAKKAK